MNANRQKRNWGATGRKIGGAADACGLVPIEDAVNKFQWGAILRSVCIHIGDYAYTRCRVTNAFKKRLTKTVAHRTDKNKSGHRVGASDPGG